MDRYSADDFTILSPGLTSIRNRISSGGGSYTVVITKESQRLDHIAHEYYGDGSLWWVIAAASGIGWWLQVPPGTRLIVPSDVV